MRFGKLKAQTDYFVTFIYKIMMELRFYVLSLIAKDRNYNQKMFNFMSEYVWITDHVSPGKVKFANLPI